MMSSYDEMAARVTRTAHSTDTILMHSTTTMATLARKVDEADAAAAGSVQAASELNDMLAAARGQASTWKMAADQAVSDADAARTELLQEVQEWKHEFESLRAQFVEFASGSLNATGTTAGSCAAESPPPK